MRKSITRVLLLATIMGGLLATSFAEIKPFTFIQVSDSHFGIKADPKSESYANCLEDIKKTYPDAAFIINCGDVTEMGYKEECALYNEVKAAHYDKPIYETIGNHDVRWSENGKENFRDAMGETYKMFDHNGVRFVSMDAAMLLEQYAHFDGEKMKQLQKDLESMADGMPMFISFHHPILQGGGFADNEFVFAEAIRPYNVPLVMVGHGHGLSLNRVNDTTYAMGGSTYGSCAYRVWEIKGDTMVGSIRRFEQNTTEENVTIALNRAPAKETKGGDLRVTNVEARTNVMTFVFEEDGVTSATSMNYVVDGTYGGVARWNVMVEAWESERHPRIPAGLHELVLSFDNKEWIMQKRMTTFRTKTPDDAAPTLLDEVLPLGSGAQSSPVIKDDALYVGCNDGKLYCFDLKTNAKKWAADLKREVVATPVVTADGYVYVGSLDKNVYCLDANDGAIVWQPPVGGAVLGGALVTDKYVIAGSGDGAVHCLNRADGKEVWKYQTAKFVKMTPALADDGKAIIFGGWDNQNVKLNIETGEKMWSVQAARSGGNSCATADILVAEGVAVANSHDYQVNGFAVEDGKKLWNWTPSENPKRFGPSYCSPVVRNGVAYSGTIDGNLMGFDVKTGEVVMDLQLRKGKNDPIFDSSPLIVGDKLYVGTVGGNLYCVNLLVKEVEWVVALQPGFIFTRPAHKDGKIYVATMNNAVYIIKSE